MKVIILPFKIFEIELREFAPWKGGYEKPSKYRTVILIIDHFCRSDPVKGIYLMFWVSTGWQTVGQSSVKLANSWSVFGNDDIDFGRSRQCWQTVGQSYEWQIRTRSSLWYPGKRKENREGKTKRKKLADFFKTHEHTFLCLYNQKEGYNRNQNIKNITWRYTPRSYSDFQNFRCHHSDI